MFILSRPRAFLGLGFRFSGLALMGGSGRGTAGALGFRSRYYGFNVCVPGLGTSNRSKHQIVGF